MKINIKKILSCVLTALLICIIADEAGYSWTTQVVGTPVGHELLTKDGAYDAGSYYQSNAVADFIGNILSKNNALPKSEIIEAGWFKKRWKSFVAVAAVVAVVVVVAVMAAPIAVTVAVALAGCAVLGVTGVWNDILPYYGTYNERTISLIAGARYQDLAEYLPGLSDCRTMQQKTENQKFHFLRRNDQIYYDTEIMRNEIDNTNYGIKYKAIIEPIIDAHRAMNAPRRHYHIGAYDKVNVHADHFAMGKVLHTVQDGYSHANRDPNSWIINEIMVYKPAGKPDGTLANIKYDQDVMNGLQIPRSERTGWLFEHESMWNTMTDPDDSHDRINSYNLGFFGIHGNLKAAAKRAKFETTELLRLWKNRDASWASKDSAEIIPFYFEDPTQPWAIVVNRICARR